MIRIFAFLTLLCLCPIWIAADDSADELQLEKTAWGKLTSWLSPRRNPYRTTVSDIEVRGRRSLFVPPPIEKQVAAIPDSEKVLSGPAARRFMLTVERDLDRLQGSLREKRWGLAVAEGRDLIETLENHRLDDEHQLRRNEVLEQVRGMIDNASDKLENEGMKSVEQDDQLAREAFANGDWAAVRSAESRIKAFVEGWDFRNPENGRQAAQWQADVTELVRRVVIREEFSTISLKVGFLVISESGPSTIVLNGKSIKEGESFDSDLKIKNITRERILFTYKGEEISWTLETP